MKGVGGFYYVRDDAGTVHECRAAGRFRKERIRPLVGDYVEFDAPTSTAAGSIRAIHDRRNELIRPPASNVDVQVILAAPHGPAIDPMLVDKLILQARVQNITPVLCINKCDLYPDEAQRLARSFEGACEAFSISAYKGLGLDHVTDLIRGKTVCFAGQSAAGKSTLLNALCGSDQLTGGLSAKTERGKHTTRTAELFYSPQAEAYIMDTPGFSVFDGVRVDKRQIGEYYADFAPFVGECRFSSCVHRDEPDCGVKEAVRAGKIDEGRYHRYLDLLANEQDRLSRTPS